MINPIIILFVYHIMLLIKNVKLKLDKEYDIENLSENIFWKRKEPKHVILMLNIRTEKIYYSKNFTIGIQNIRKVNFIRRFMIWKILVKKILDKIRPLNIDLIQHLLFTFIGMPNTYFGYPQNTRYNTYMYTDDLH